MANKTKMPKRISGSLNRHPVAGSKSANRNNARNSSTTWDVDAEKEAITRSLNSKKRALNDNGDLDSDSDCDSDLDSEQPLVKKSNKTDGDELLEDIDLQTAIRAGLNGGSSTKKRRAECIPGIPASKMCGPQLVQCDNCGPKMGMNPLFFLLCFLIFGIMVLVQQYKVEMA